MPKITWLLLGVLVLSIVANGLLGFSTYLYGTQLRQTQEKLSERIVAYNEATAGLKTTKSALQAANASITWLRDDLATAQAELGRAEISINNFRDRATTAEYFVSRAKCTVMVDELVAYGADSNSDVKAAIVSALERTYSGSVRSASFATLWNDSLTSILTADWGNGTTKTVLAWDRTNHLTNIYDANSGCVMYTR